MTTEGEINRQFGKFTLLDRIGSGGMAEIWKSSLAGVDGFQKILVVKKILPKHANNRQFVTMFVQEAKVCSGLHHANVVQIYELGEEAGEYFIAMEYVQGYDLLKVLTRASRSRMALPPELCLYVVSEICKGLGYAHAATDIGGRPLNIIHLDVSPSNVLISQDGEVKLTDFGVARASVEGAPTRSDDRLKGKLGYMSPEQVTGKPLDSRSDIFAIGIILYELFTLKRLFLGKTDIETLKNIRDANVDPRLRRHPEIPGPISEVIRKALTVNVETRYQTAFEIEEAIAQYLFENRIRVTGQMLAKYIRALFSGAEPELEGGSAAEEASAQRDTRADAYGVERPVEAPAHVSDVTQVKLRAASAKAAANSEFRFRSEDGDVFGPITYNNLSNLIRTRSVNAEELISVDGQEWCPANEIATLQPLLEPLKRELEEPDDIGVFGPGNAGRLLARMAAGKRTGLLRLSEGQHIKRVYFRRGKPIHIASTRKSELFGAMLLATGVITQEQLEAAIQEVRDGGGPTGTALVRLGVMTQAELFRHLEDQFREKFLQVFTWKDGSYEYFRGEESGPGVVPFLLNPFPAIVEGLRTRVLPEFVESYFATVGGHKTIRLVTDPPFDVNALKFTPREHRVRMALSVRPTTLDALLKAVANTPEERRIALFVLFVLHQTEHIRIR